MARVARVAQVARVSWVVEATRVAWSWESEWPQPLWAWVPCVPAPSSNCIRTRALEQALEQALEWAPASFGHIQTRAPMRVPEQKFSRC